MKKLLLALTALVISAALAGQGTFPTEEEGRMLLNSKTGIVLDASSFSPFNPAIREAVENYWTITPFEFISVNEFNERMNDPSYSFLVVTETTYQRDRSGASYSFLNLLLGKEVRHIDDMPEFAAIPLAFAGGDEDEIDYQYKLGLILLFMQKHARVVMENSSSPGVRFLRYYNKYVPEIEGKTILARAEDMAESLRTEAAIADHYDGEFRLVSEDEIIEAVAERRPNTLILHKVGPPGELNGAYVFKMLISTEDAKIYYHNEHRINRRSPNGFLRADLRRMSRF